MQHKCKVTVIDKKLYPELQQRYCADPQSGPCPCYNVGDEFVFARYGAADDFWHIGAGTLRTPGASGTAGGAGLAHCSEAWDAIARYIYTALQGGSIMRGWMNDERVMIACCSDGTRPVIFKIERLDYKAVHVPGLESAEKAASLSSALAALPGVSSVAVRAEEGFIEVYVDGAVPDEAIRAAAPEAVRID